MIHDLLYQMIEETFPHPMTSGQSHAARQLSQFLTSRSPHPAFILRGFAGTGKTTLVSAVVSVLRELKKEVVLLAPTGRAAKVFAAYAKTPAYTIHKEIYRQQTFDGENTKFSLGFNKTPETLFIVDEASMLSNQYGAESLFGTGCVLDDLIQYVYSASGCRLLLIGDKAQLPPVGEDESPALMGETLSHYGLSVQEADLTEVVRQTSESDVLAAATHLRRLLTEGFKGKPLLVGSEKGEVRFLSGGELIDELESAYADFGEEDTIVVTRSNKQANMYNHGIRARIFDREPDPTRGDRIMIVKNNYHWAEKWARELKEGEKMPFDFIANGDTAEIVRLSNIHVQFNCEFADATLRFPDYDDFEMDCRLLLDTLTSESPSLTAEESQDLYEQIKADYAHIPQKKERMKAIREDPYYNALQVKYAYAVTCHKAQGGQWSRVFVDQGFISEETTGKQYLRWLYTALTRTTDRLYLVNWPKGQRED